MGCKMICTQNGKGEIYNEIPLLLQIKQSDIPNHHLHPQNVNVPINTLESWRLLSTIVIFQQSVGKKNKNCVSICGERSGKGSDPKH